MKKLYRILFLVALFVLTICVSSYATGDDTVFTQTELVDGLFSNIESADGTSYNITVDASKLLSIDSSSYTDDVISNEIYIKLPETATKATVKYADETTADLKIVTTADSNYAVCPIPVLKRINNVYYPAFLNNLKANNTATNSGTVEFLADDSSSVGNITFSAKLDTTTFSGALIYIDSTSTDSYSSEPVNGDITTSYTYDRIMANGDCTIHVLLEEKVADSITLSPFGTLTYVGESQTDSVYTHEYSLKISDETIFNKNILCMLSSSENNILHVNEFNFTGDLVENSNPDTNPDTKPDEQPETKPDDKTTISAEDAATKIKLEAATGVVPDDTTLDVSVVTDGEIFEKIKAALGDVKFNVFDITPLSNGQPVTLNGKVKISIPIPSDFNKSNLVVYRFDSDGTKTDYSVTVDGNYAVIETNHFSNYVLAEKAATENGTSATGENNLDSEPKTGMENPVSFVVTVLIIACLGLAICIKKISK